MIDVKQSATIAESYLKTLLPHANDVTLEEVEISADDRLWSITLSALVPAPAPSTTGPQFSIPALEGLFRQSQRVYKILEINAETGSVRSMKIRTVQ